MNKSQALRAMEELRKGIPPVGLVEHFTVGRQSEIAALQQHLVNDDSTVLLLKANYGSGKSHLLRLIREKALKLNCAVSYVALDAKSGIRFNRMDQVLGAILRSIELPGDRGGAGVRGLFDALCEVADRECRKGKDNFWTRLTKSGCWEFSETLKSPALFVALRAWATRNSDAQDLAADWLLKSEAYRAQRKRLYTSLVADLRKHFRDPRAEWQFYKDEVFLLHTSAYRQSWDALADVDTLIKAAGMKGLVVLFDEFEDVLTNLTSINHQEAAFWNLFLFFAGERFPGMTFYAVTPGFVDKCKSLLLKKERYDFDYRQFDELPTFAMSPLREGELQSLALRIVDAHAVAYGYQPDPRVVKRIEALVSRDAKSPSQDRARFTIKEVVKHLDDALEGA